MLGLTSTSCLRGGLRNLSLGVVTSSVVSSTGIAKVVFSVEDTTMEFRGKEKRSAGKSSLSSHMFERQWQRCLKPYYLSPFPV